jgi:hypothetical protein
MLRRAPFTVVVRFPAMTVARVHVSQSPAGYELVRTNAPAAELNPLGGGIAEEDGNKDQSLYLSGAERASFHNWPRPSGSAHRFDTITADAGAVIARRQVTAFVTPDRIRHSVEDFAGDVVYLACRLIGSASGVEVQRQGLKLRFDKQVATAEAVRPKADGSQVIATVQGRRITAGRFREKYQQQLAFYKQAYGAKVTDEMQRQLRVDLKALQVLIDEEAALVEAERRGIVVTEAEVWASIQSMPAFQEKNRFVGDPQFRKMLAAQTPPITPDVFLESARRSMVVDRLQLAVVKNFDGMARLDAYNAYLWQAEKKMQIVVARDVLDRIVAEK